MAKAGHTGDVETIEAGLTDADAAIRAAALGAADRAGILTAAVLKRGLRDPARSVRYRAVEVAARQSDAVGLAVARQLVDLVGPGRREESRRLDGEPDSGLPTGIGTADLAEAAAFALGELPMTEPDRSDAVAALEAQAGHHPDALCREAAVAALGALEAGRDTIVAAMTDVATVRRRAVLALAPFDDEGIEAVLQTALTDRDLQVRQSAEELLA